MIRHLGSKSLATTAVAALPLLLSHASLAEGRILDDPPIRNEILEAAAPDTHDIVDAVSDTLLTLHVDGAAVRVPYYANRLLDGTYTDVTRAIVVIHGTLRNADDYFHSIMDAADLVPGADATTIVVAPQFLVEGDLDEYGLPEDIPFWAYYDWRRGDQSASSADHPRSVRLSSFAIVDTIVYRLATQNPNLTQIVVAGHSAGGQFTNRYAAGNRMQQIVGAGYGIQVRYIVSNPSTYMYMNDERWVEGTAYDFAVPDAEAIAACPGYDHYQYGLLDPNPYMSIGSDVLRGQYSQREVIYLLGGDDTDPNSYYLDKDCPAMLEGTNRLQRGIIYANHLIDFFGSWIFELHALAVVPGVGHDGHAMFTSACGVYYLFDSGACQGTPPASHWLDVTTSLLRAVETRSVAWGDYDHDFDQDLFLAAGNSSDKLIRNTGGGTFADATKAPLNDPGDGMAAAWGDYDNDGKPDLYLVNWRSPNRLLHNDGGGDFSDRTSGPLGISADCADATWADFDNDGDLDLYVTRTNGEANTLVRNDGPQGFADVTTNLLGHAGNNRGAAWGDYDGDGDLDLYVTANGPNRLIRNDGGGSFSDATAGPLGDTGNGSSASWGDYDNDGDADLYLVNRFSRCRLLRNDGAGVFGDVTEPPLDDAGNGHSATWGDYDNDGWLDLYLSIAGGPNRLFHNEGDGSFAEASEYPLNDSGESYCAAWADYDGDGDLDLYLATHNGPNKLFRNVNVTTNHWLAVDLIGTVSNVSAIGARLTVFAGGVERTRWVGGDAGYLAQNSLTAEFGLGVAASVDSLVIDWPSGIHQRVTHVSADRRTSLFETNQPEEVGDASPATPGRRLILFPNPARDRVSIRWNQPAGGRATLRIFDAGGRLVRAFDDGGPAGLREIIWDGRSAAGSRLPSGIYLFRLDARDRPALAHLLLLK